MQTDDDMQTEFEMQAEVGFSAERLSQLRAHHGLGRAQMASKLGCARSTYTGWELENFVPPVMLYDKLATAFGIGAVMFVMRRSEVPDVQPGVIDIDVGNEVASRVVQMYEDVGLKFKYSDVIETTILLLGCPEAMRGQRLEGVKEGLLRAKKLLGRSR